VERKEKGRKERHDMPLRKQKEGRKEGRIGRKEEKGRRGGEREESQEGHLLL
jgi:hypothetical protein